MVLIPHRRATNKAIIRLLQPSQPLGFVNPDPEAIRALLKSAKNIAVVGFSPRPHRASHKTIWLQDGIVNEEGARKALAAGMTVVMDRCIMRDYARLCLSP